MTSAIIADIREKLKDLADEKTRISGMRFFKEKVEMYGVKTPVVGKISKEYFKRINGTEKKDVFALCEELWKSGYMEEAVIACHWSYYLHKQFKPDDLKVFEKWIKTYVGNWASCDTLCNHTVGEFIEMYPQYIKTLKAWTRSKNRWMKRASAVTLIIPAKKGSFLKDIFQIADILLKDPDDMVQKGYGWMLKAASRLHQKEVFKYVMKNKKEMPRTALRYAIEKMPEKMRKRALAL